MNESGWSFEVISIDEEPDGSANIEINLSMEALVAFAKIGLQHVLETKAKEILDGVGYSESEGA